jgi:hypothetical protein
MTARISAALIGAAVMVIAGVTIAGGCSETSDGRRPTAPAEGPEQIDAPRAPDGPAEALVTAGGLTARATADSHCLRGPDGAYCADSTGLDDHSPSLPVGRGGSVGIEVGARANGVTAWVARIEGGFGEGRLSAPTVARRRSRRATRWVVRMPDRDVPGNSSLRFRVRYRDWHGDPVFFDLRIRNDG